jgi:hypothetical protein
MKDEEFSLDAPGAGLLTVAAGSKGARFVDRSRRVFQSLKEWPIFSARAWAGQLTAGYQRGLYAAGLTIVCLTITPAARAAQAIHFNLPADEIDKSLLKFSTQSHIECLYVGDVKSRTQPVVGMLEPLEALRLMLTGTSLVYEILSNPLSIVVKPFKTPTHSPISVADNLAQKPHHQVTVRGQSQKVGGFMPAWGSRIQDFGKPSLTQEDLSQAPEPGAERGSDRE